MTERRQRPVRFGLALVALLLLSGCATYSDKFANLRPELASGQFDAALATVEENAGSKDRLLYWLERGLILHYADRWVESNEAFAAAERTADELYTKSISEGALSLISNDNAISYRARPYEMAMVPYFKALNYIYLQDRSAAQVEARRASLLLSKYVDATLSGVRDEDGDELRQISNNAFLHYYSGMLYDWDGEINDAFTAYRNAAVAYQQNHDLLQEQIPPSLGRDLDRVAKRLGFRQELIDLRKSCGAVFAGSESADLDLPTTRQDYEEAAQGGWQSGHGEVVLLIETGFVPKKTQVRFDFPIFESETYDDPDYWGWEIQAGLGNLQAFTKGRKIEYWVTVAAPELQDEPGPVGGVRVSVPTLDGHAVGTRASNLLRAARITFDAEKPTILFKTIARGLTKYLATRQAKKSGGSWAGFAANLFGAATETADTRSWLTLPEDVYLVRLSLQAGQHDLQVQLLDQQGRALGSETIPAVDVVAGDWTFLSRRVF